jgi:hypothetical protein
MYPQADDPLIEQVWQIMQKHKGYDRRIDRDTLTFAVYHKVSKSYDRKVRDALAELPVVWKDGYFVPETAAEAEQYRASMRSRQAAIGKRLRILDEWLTGQREPERAEQMMLLDF